MTDPGEHPFSIDGDGGARLAVRVTPRAKRSELGGVADIGDGRVALSVRLAAPPVEGAANRLLINLLAESLEVPKSSIRIVSGETSRIKVVAIDSVSESALRRLYRLGPH